MLTTCNNSLDKWLDHLQCQNNVFNSIFSRSITTLSQNGNIAKYDHYLLYYVSSQGQVFCLFIFIYQTIYLMHIFFGFLILKLQILFISGEQ